MMAPLLSLGEEEVGQLIGLAGILQTLRVIPPFSASTVIFTSPFSPLHSYLSRLSPSLYALQMVFKLLRRQREVQRLPLRRLQRRKRDVELLAKRGIRLHITRSPLPHHIERSRVDANHNGLIALDHPRVASNLALHEPVPIIEHLRRLRRHLDLNVVLVRREKRKLLEQRRPRLHVSPFPRFYGFSLQNGERDVARALELFDHGVARAGHHVVRGVLRGIARR